MNKFQWNIKQNSYIFIQENAFENVVCEMASICPDHNTLRYPIIIALLYALPYVTSPCNGETQPFYTYMFCCYNDQITKAATSQAHRLTSPEQCFV